MAQVEKTVLIEHGAADMFALVDRVEDYAQFLPWCGGTTLIERSAEFTLATIHIDYHGVKQSFTTRNRKEAPTWMLIELERGPFQRLTGHWQFKPLAEGACKVEFRLEYEFSSKVLEKLFGPVFHYIASTFVEAFIVRADAVYGEEDSKS
jgi:ribosome-associated toxin RatA of RatAB toxin-antitoxin module